MPFGNVPALAACKDVIPAVNVLQLTPHTEAVLMYRSLELQNHAAQLPAGAPENPMSNTYISS